MENELFNQLTINFEKDTVSLTVTGCPIEFADCLFTANHKMMEIISSEVVNRQAELELVNHQGKSSD